MVHRELITTPLRSSLVELLLWALGRRLRVRVTGPSMAPTLRPGDHVLVDLGAFRASGPAVGDLVLATHPHTAVRIIKRIASTGPSGAVELQGDNAALSTDSREFGPVELAAVLGRVTARFP